MLSVPMDRVEQTGEPLGLTGQVHPCELGEQASRRKMSISLDACIDRWADCCSSCYILGGQMQTCRTGTRHFKFTESVSAKLMWWGFKTEIRLNYRRIREILFLIHLSYTLTIHHMDIQYWIHKWHHNLHIHIFH